MSDAERALRDLLSDPTLRLEVRPEFSSAHTNYREEIRRAIAHELGASERIFDLSRPLLKVGDRSVSISHCPTLGGFVHSLRPIGFDVEASDRVRPAAISRISKPEEADGAPSFAALWAAKEAAFKALQHAETKPELLSQIEIGLWKTSEIGSQIGTFSLANLSDFSSRGALGCVIGQKEHVLCTFALAP